MKKVLLPMCIFLLAACGQQNNMENNTNEPRPQGVSTKNEEVADDNRRNNIDKADHLANLASQVRGVKGARAVVAGDYAVIGIDVDKDMDRSKVGSLKYSVVESIKHDPLGAGAVVVADPDLNERLDELRNDFAAGQPLQGIMNELADITGRVMPEAPPREMNKNPEEAPQKPKREMNQNENRTLNKEQQEQSTEE